MNSKLSLILPIYNGEKTLAKTLDSLLNQTYKSFELIACIDGSTDRSLEILQSYSNRFNSLRIIINVKNLGLGPTMNRLVYNSNSEYIAVAEQDDWYYPERLQKQLEILDTMPNVGLVSGIADFWDGSKITFRFPGILVNGNQYPTKEEMFLLNYRNQIKVVNSCMMFRKSVHHEFGLYFSNHYPNIPIDWAYILRFCLVSDIHGINQSLVLLNREIDRKSVTNSEKRKFLANYELLRSFKFEYPNIIKNSDYKYSKTTQHLMELSEFNKFKWPIIFLKFFIQNPFDKRWKKYIFKRMKINYLYV